MYRPFLYNTVSFFQNWQKTSSRATRCARVQCMPVCSSFTLALTLACQGLSSTPSHLCKSSAGNVRHGAPEVPFAFPVLVRSIGFGQFRFSDLLHSPHFPFPSEPALSFLLRTNGC